jgi:hypothetical protein
MATAITIRPSTDRDLAALRRLAALDDRGTPHGDAMLAFVDGELRAALTLDGRKALADPFRRTAELVELLHVRVDQKRAA